MQFLQTTLNGEHNAQITATLISELLVKLRIDKLHQKVYHILNNKTKATEQAESLHKLQAIYL